MAFVVDASVTASWMLPDEENPLAEFVQSLLVDENAVAPFVWWFEVRNILLIAERRQRLTRSDADRLIATLNTYPISLDVEPGESDTLQIARDHALTYYDASYVELAKRRSLPLATLDGRMAAAARDAGINLVVAV